MRTSMLSARREQRCEPRHQAGSMHTGWEAMVVEKITTFSLATNSPPRWLRRLCPVRDRVPNLVRDRDLLLWRRPTPTLRSLAVLQVAPADENHRADSAFNSRIWAESSPGQSTRETTAPFTLILITHNCSRLWGLAALKTQCSVGWRTRLPSPSMLSL